jgi:hypothetical protein
MSVMAHILMKKKRHAAASFQSKQNSTLETPQVARFQRRMTRPNHSRPA